MPALLIKISIGLARAEICFLTHSKLQTSSSRISADPPSCFMMLTNSSSFSALLAAAIT
jgi:hypothetical protein